MEVFYEQFLSGDFSKKRNQMKIIQTTILIIAAIVYIFLGLIPTILIGVLYLCTIVIANNCFVEYEYTLTNNELDITKIVNQSKRKVICTIDISQISKVSTTDKTNGQVKRKKCYVGNEKLQTIVLTVPHNGENVNFVLKVDDELLLLFKRVNKSSFNI